MLVAEDPAQAESLVLFSYPLHPPGKPDRLRTGHFSQLSVPAIFVHGSADPFGTLSEVETAAAIIPAPTKIIPVHGAGHDLRQGRFDFGEVVAAVT